jgi:putative ABC transport system permease protein
MSLALSTLIYEWRRYLAAVIALAMAGLMVLATLGMFLGIGQAFTAQIDRSRADIMILSPKVESLDGPAGVPRRIMPQIYMHPEVVEVADLAVSFGQFQNVPQKGEKPKRDGVRVWAVDTTPGAVTLPTDYPETVRRALEEPYAVAIDETALKKLGVKLGDKATINGKTVYVKAVLHGYANMMAATVVCSRSTLRMLGMAQTGPRAGPLFVRLRHPEKAEQVAADLNRMSHGAYRAWTRPELAAANEKSMFKEQIIAVMLGFMLVIGALVGVVITWMTLRGAIFANIKEFASLRALGVSMGSLRLIVMELSFWVGVTGILTTGGLMLVVVSLANSNGVPMAVDFGGALTVSLMLMVIAMLSGFLSLGILKQSQPADLLR